jgi:hypothetical protein
MLSACLPTSLFERECLNRLRPLSAYTMPGRYLAAR